LNARTLRRLWFLGLWLLVPWPLLVYSEAFVPAARYMLLGGVAATVALAEGASGPVGLIVLLLLGYGVVTSVLCWVIAWLVTRVLTRLPPNIARVITLGCLGGGLLAGLLFEPYRTPFGRALTGGLLQVLS
jgi:hypothetical protein